MLARALTFLRADFCPAQDQLRRAPIEGSRAAGQLVESAPGVRPLLEGSSSGALVGSFARKLQCHPLQSGVGKAGCAQSTGWEGGFGGMFHACAAAYTHVVMLLLGNRACALCEMSGFAEPVNRLSSLFVIVLWVMWPD